MIETLIFLIIVVLVIAIVLWITAGTIEPRLPQPAGRFVTVAVALIAILVLLSAAAGRFGMRLP